MQVDKAIKRLRFDAGISQQELAEILGIQQSVISKYERGKLKPSYKVLKMLITLAKKFSIDIDFFWYRFFLTGIFLQ